MSYFNSTEIPRIATASYAYCCLLYTSDAADERSSVDLGGRRIIKKKQTHTHTQQHNNTISPNTDVTHTKTNED